MRQNVKETNLSEAIHLDKKKKNRIAHAIIVQVPK